MVFLWQQHRHTTIQKLRIVKTQCEMVDGELSGDFSGACFRNPFISVCYIIQVFFILAVFAKFLQKLAIRSYLSRDQIDGMKRRTDQVQVEEPEINDVNEQDNSIQDTNRPKRRHIDADISLQGWFFIYFFPVDTR